MRNQYNWLFKMQNQRKDSAFSLHVKRCRKVRSCVLPVLLLQHKDMSCGANLYQLNPWGDPMCSEDTPILTRKETWHGCAPDVLGRFLKCHNVDNLDIFTQCRRKSSSQPSKLQTLLKTACVCTQGVWFKGIDDIHQHLVSTHFSKYIRSKIKKIWAQDSHDVKEILNDLSVWATQLCHWPAGLCTCFHLGWTVSKPLQNCARWKDLAKGRSATSFGRCHWNWPLKPRCLIASLPGDNGCTIDRLRKIWHGPSHEACITVSRDSKSVTTRSPQHRSLNFLGLRSMNSRRSIRSLTFTTLDQLDDRYWSGHAFFDVRSLQEYLQSWDSPQCHNILGKSRQPVRVSRQA